MAVSLGACFIPAAAAAAALVVVRVLLPQVLRVLAELLLHTLLLPNSDVAGGNQDSAAHKQQALAYPLVAVVRAALHPFTGGNRNEGVSSSWLALGISTRFSWPTRAQRRLLWVKLEASNVQLNPTLLASLDLVLRCRKVSLHRLCLQFELCISTPALRARLHMEGMTR